MKRGSYRIEWIARCACRVDCRVEVTFPERRKAQAVVERFARDRGKPFTLVRRDITINERVIDIPMPEAT